MPIALNILSIITVTFVLGDMEVYLEPKFFKWLYQLKNVIGRSNAVKSPSADFNACDDFLVTVITGHIIAAFAEISEDFNLSEAWMDTVDNRKKLLSEICGKLMENYLRFSFNEI